MPIPASSNACRNTSWACRSAASDCLRSEMSRRFATQPWTLGSSNTFVNVTSNQRHVPSWWRRRVSTRADADSVGVSSSIAAKRATSPSSMIVFISMPTDSCGL